MSKYIQKSPSFYNRFSGKVSLSYDEYVGVSEGDILRIEFYGPNGFTCHVKVRQWMIDRIENRGDYYLLPYAKKYQPSNKSKIEVIVKIDGKSVLNHSDVVDAHIAQEITGDITAQVSECPCGVSWSNCSKKHY